MLLATYTTSTFTTTMHIVNVGFAILDPIYLRLLFSHTYTHSPLYVSGEEKLRRSYYLYFQKREIIESRADGGRLVDHTRVNLCLHINRILSCASQTFFDCSGMEAVISINTMRLVTTTRGFT